ADRGQGLDRTEAGDRSRLRAARWHPARIGGAWRRAGARPQGWRRGGDRDQTTDRGERHGDPAGHEEEGRLWLPELELGRARRCAGPRARARRAAAEGAVKAALAGLAVVLSAARADAFCGFYVGQGSVRPARGGGAAP